MTNEEVKEAFDKFRDYLMDNGVHIGAMLLSADNHTWAWGYPDDIERALLRTIAIKHRLKVEPL